MRWGYTELRKDDFKLDCSKSYKLPMIRQYSHYPNEIEDEVVCSVTQTKDGYLFSKEGYKDKLFVPTYVEFLLYNKYINIIN